MVENSYTKILNIRLENRVYNVNIYALTLPFTKDLSQCLLNRGFKVIAKVKYLVGIIRVSSMYSMYLLSTISDNGIVCRAKAQVVVRVASAYLYKYKASR